MAAPTAASSALPSPPLTLVNTDACIFCKTATSLFVLTESCTAYELARTIDALFEELRTTGPFVAIGDLGPSWFNSPSSPYGSSIQGRVIHSWPTKKGFLPKGGDRVGDKKVPVIVLGAAKEVIGETLQELVYFRLAQDDTRTPTATSRTYTPLATDARIYALSHAHFTKQFSSAYPCIEVGPEIVMTSLLEHILEVLPDVSRLFMSYLRQQRSPEVDLKTKHVAMGQELFDRCKTEGKASHAGVEAIEKTLLFAHIMPLSVFSRCGIAVTSASQRDTIADYFAATWEGVGDEVIRWDRSQLTSS